MRREQWAKRATRADRRALAAGEVLGEIPAPVPQEVRPATGTVHPDEVDQRDNAVERRK